MAIIRVFGVALCVTLAVFATVFVQGQVLAIGDGLIESVPGFVASYARWQPDMLAGFPIYADPSKAFWYPLRALHVIPNGYNLYVIFAYALAATATYAYVRNITGSVYAAIASASAFASGGFMIAQLGHPMIVEPACWYCVAIWSLDAYIRSRKGGWLLALSVAVLLSFTAGQPQIAAFSVSLLLSYLLFVGYEVSLRASGRLYVEGALAIVFGISGAAMCWLPTVAQSTQSVRAGLDFASYVMFSISPKHIALMLAFPFVGGGGTASIYHGPIVGGSNFVETANYVPLAALALAVLAPLSGRRRLALYWAAIACIGLALSVGDALPLAALTFHHLPGYNLLRIPGRHAFEFTFAAAVLSGLGVVALERLATRRIALVGAVGFGLALLAVATADVVLQRADALRQPSVVVFLIAGAIQIALLLAAAVALRRPLRSRLASCAVVIGAATFGTTAYWRDAPSATVLEQPAFVRLLGTLPRAPGQRVYTEGDETHPELRPNLPSVWGIPEFGGYTPLQYATSRIVLQTGEDERLLNVASPLIDAAAVRYVVTPAQREIALAASAPFAPWDLGNFLSAGRPDAPRMLTFGVPHPRIANRITLVTALGASVGVRQGTQIATVVIHGRSGAQQTSSLRAGVETAELAYDRADVAGTVRHDRAAVYERNGDVDWYLSSLPVKLHEPIVSVSFAMIDPQASLNVRKISLIDDAHARAYPFPLSAKYYGEPGHFVHVADVAGVSVFENRRSGPGVWIARAIPLAFDASNDDALAAYRERLMHVDLRSDATVSPVGDLPIASGRAAIVTATPERRDVAASCAGRCLLVSSMTFTDDWKVDVDGRPGELLRSDGIFQGVVLPGGSHAVSFRYAPAPARNGLLISGGSMAALLALYMARLRRPRVPA